MDVQLMGLALWPRKPLEKVIALVKVPVFHFKKCKCTSIILHVAGVTAHQAMNVSHNLSCKHEKLTSVIYSTTDISQVGIAEK